MRTILVFLAVTLLLPQASAIPINADAQQCAGGFSAYNGWCVYLTDYQMVFDEAVGSCNRVGAFAPSDVDFWVNSINDLKPLDDHFWLDANCPSNGELYQWGDETPTDFLGAKNELASCRTGNALHIHRDGLEIWGTTPEIVAPALCAYKPGATAAPPAAPINDETESAPVETVPPTLPEATVAPTDATVDYCTCEPSSIYLDVAFVVDASTDMTDAVVKDASATIQSLLFGLTHGTQFYQTNVAVVAYAENVKTVSNFGDIRTVNDILNFDLPYLGGNATKMRDAVKTATSLISENSRNYTRGAVFLLSKSFDQLDAVNIFAAAQEFKDNGGIFISVDYTNGGYVKGREALASPGYYINDAATPNSLVPDMLYALCDANCFCPKGQTAYNIPNAIGRAVPMGCYHVADSSAVYAAAEPNCAKQHGFVATTHDEAKNFFLTSLFPPKTPFWIGLHLAGSTLEWVDGSVDQSTYWAPGNPMAGKDCVYVQQTTGFNSQWYSAGCTDPMKATLAYSCQLTPCSTEYNCYDYTHA